MITFRMDTKCESSRYHSIGYDDTRKFRKLSICHILMTIQCSATSCHQVLHEDIFNLRGHFEIRSEPSK